MNYHFYERGQNKALISGNSVMPKKISSGNSLHFYLLGDELDVWNNRYESHETFILNFFTLSIHSFCNIYSWIKLNIEIK